MAIAYQFSQGWATFGLSLPPRAATLNVRVGTLPSQTDVKVRWPDGSIRHAVVTTHIPTAGTYPITQWTFGPGGFAPKWPKVEVVFSLADGTQYTAILPPGETTDSWLKGPLVHESRKVVTPSSAGVPHPLLQVIFDVRSYADGQHRVDISVQNTRDIAAGSSVEYGVGIYVNGSFEWAQDGVNHSYLTRWRKTVSTFGYVESEVLPDLEPFYQSGALPRFLDTVESPAYLSTGGRFNILQFGDMSPDMSSPGGRPEIGPYPNWVAQYLVHKTRPQWDYMIASADLASSWRGHIAEPDGTTLVSVERYPDYWLDGRAGTRTAPVYGLNGPDAPRGLSPTGGPYPGGWSESIETAHMPSLSYVPYLLTGDRYHLDEMKYWANFTLLSSIAGRQGAKGLLVDNQPRGIAWAMRSLADLATYIPDADPTRSYFRSKLLSNLDWLNTVGAGYNGGPFEFLFPQGPFPPTPNDITYSPWMVNYIGWALERARQHGWGEGAMLARIARVQLRFFTDPGWPLAQWTYYPTVGDRSTGAWLQSMADVYRRSYAADPRNGGFPGQYGVDARLVLQVGVRLGLPGAQQALDYLEGVAGMSTDLAHRSGWAVQAP